VAAFEHQEEAEQFHHAPPERLDKFELMLSATKTWVIAFHRDPPRRTVAIPPRPSSLRISYLPMFICV
jgi:hypothetical protein